MVGGGWAGAGMYGQRGWVGLSGELYTARVSGGLPFLRPVQSM